MNLSIKAKINKFINYLKVDVDFSIHKQINAPWSSFSNIVDVSLVDKLPLKASKLVTPVDVVEVKLKDIVNKFDKIFFTDGSVGTDGKVGAALFSPSIPVTLFYKLPDTFSIYYAEAFAIFKALTYIQENHVQNVCVISDSIKVLHDIRYCNLEGSPHPSIISNISHILGRNSITNLQIIWFPGHYDNVHLRTIDNAAKTASKLQISHGISFTRDEALLGVDEWINGIWQESWTSNPTCTYQRLFTLSKRISPVIGSRKKDTIISRIRMQQTRLNAGKVEIGLHHDGLCQTRGVEQDAMHYILNCNATGELRENIIRFCGQGISWNFQTLISDRNVAGIIADFIIASNTEV